MNEYVSLPTPLEFLEGEICGSYRTSCVAGELAIVGLKVAGCALALLCAYDGVAFLKRAGQKYIHRAQIAWTCWRNPAFAAEKELKRINKDINSCNAHMEGLLKRRTELITGVSSTR